MLRRQRLRKQHFLCLKMLQIKSRGVQALLAVPYCFSLKAGVSAV